MRDTVYARPLIPLLVSLILGIICGTEFPGYRLWAFLAAALAGSALVWQTVKREPAYCTPLVFLAALGYLLIQPWTAPCFPDNHLIRFADSGKRIITGIVAESPRPYVKGVRVLLDAYTLENPADKSTPAQKVTGRARITLAGDIPPLDKGDRIRVFGRVKHIHNFNNPGGFDYRRFMAFQKVWVTGYVPVRELLSVQRKKGTRLFSVERIRNRIESLIREACPGEDGAVLSALIIGRRETIPADLRERFNRAGVGHLLAISGLHIGIVAGAVFWVGAWLLGYGRFFLQRAWTRKGAALLAFTLAAAYGFLAGMSPSTQRAVIMVSVFLLTILIGREQDPLNTLAAAALLILLVNPPALFSVSFQLSFTAVAAIIIGMAGIAKQSRPADPLTKRHLFTPLLFRLSALVWVSLLAIVASAPLGMFYFNRVSLVGLGANLTLVPIVGFCVLPTGLFAVLLSFVSLSLAQLGFQICGQILSWGIEILDFWAALPFAALQTVTPSIIELILFYTLLGCVLSIIDPITRENRRRIVAVVCLLVLIGSGLDALYWGYTRFWHRDLRVTVIDVGQGSAALLELLGGKVMLLDGGGFSDNRVFDVGALIIAPLLWRKKIASVKTLILSHPNSDHLNGLLYIAAHFNVQEIWSNGEPADTFGYRLFQKILAQKRIAAIPYKSLARSRQLNRVQVEILYPPADFLSRRKTEKWRTTNNNSLVVKLSIGSTSILFAGDIMADAEKELIQMAGEKLKSTILIAPHHGSRSSNTARFVNAVRPESIVFSARRSTPPFPHPVVLRRYFLRGCRIWRTDRQGAVRIVTDGSRLKIRARVDPSKDSLQ